MTKIENQKPVKIPRFFKKNPTFFFPRSFLNPGVMLMTKIKNQNPVKIPHFFTFWRGERVFFF
jgi:hypothetical protein